MTCPKIGSITRRRQVPVSSAARVRAVLGGDRAVALQPAGFVLDPGQGLQADDHADGGLHAVPGRQPTTEPAQDSVDQHVGAARRCSRVRSSSRGAVRGAARAPATLSPAPSVTTNGSRWSPARPAPPRWAAPQRGRCRRTPQIQHPGTGVPQPGQVRPDPHPTAVLPLRRRLPVRVVLQRRQLPPGEVHILMHVRYVMRTRVRIQAFCPYFIG